MLAAASVSVTPGATVLTRIPSGPSSTAKERTNASSAALALLCAAKPPLACLESVLEMAMMLPLWRSSISGTTAWQG
jgi:hypothetical protein